MKPGDLVRGIPRGRIGTPVIGMILEKSTRTNFWGDKEYVWWKVLCDDGIIVEEVEHYMELIP